MFPPKKTKCLGSLRMDWKWDCELWKSVAWQHPVMDVLCFYIHWTYASISSIITSIFWNWCHHFGGVQWKWPRWRHPGAQCSCRWPLADYRNSLGWLWMIHDDPYVTKCRGAEILDAFTGCRFFWTCLGYWKLGRPSTTRITHFDYLWLAWSFLLAKDMHKCYIYIYVIYIYIYI